jgi:hypothetical protein
LLNICTRGPAVKVAAAVAEQSLVAIWVVVAVVLAAAVAAAAGPLVVTEVLAAAVAARKVLVDSAALAVEVRVAGTQAVAARAP